MANETHIMEKRQPTDPDTFFTMAEGSLNQSLVMENIPMGNHHALGCSRGARSVLQKRQVIPLNRLGLERLGI